ncbi:phage tail protein, partial [Streptococcus lutetiensis]
LYAPISAQLYPSTFTSETQSDQWTRRDMDFNVKSIQQLETEGLKQLKASAYPELTYEFDGYIDADIGDTVELSDGGFANTLLIEARIFEQKLSFSTKKNWKTTLGNFRALQSKLSNDIQSELERLVEDAKPYNIRISTDNGTMFKNNEGESLVKATLWKGGKVVSRDVSWRWALDGVVTVGMQYRVQAKDITDTAVLTVSGYVGNTEVATTEITLANMVEQIDLVILTSNGNTFKNNNIASTLTATLWRGNKEIDKDGTEFSYVWKKINSDETPDENWNQDHSYSQKSIRITEADVFRRATFSCEVQYVGKRV